MHADRPNRVMLILLALVLIAAGGAIGAASLGVFGHFTQHSMLLVNPAGHYVGSHGAWLWPVIAVAGVVIAMLALRWLAALLFSTDRAGDLVIAPNDPAARTTLAAGALTGAVVNEIEGYRGVNSVRARLIGSASDPRLVVLATLEESANLARLRERLEAEALTHAREAMASPEMPVQLDLTVTTRRATRVE